MNTSTIDPLTLPSLPLSQAADLPETQSVYFVLDGDEVVYIGRSIKLKQRWDFSRSHHVLPKLLERTKIRIAWLECSDSGLIGDIEMALISHFAPPLNRRRSLCPVPSKTLSVIISEETQKRLEQFAKSRLWSVSQSARVLIEQGLERESVGQNSVNGKPAQVQTTSLKELVRQNYFSIMNSGKIGHQRLKDLSFGQKPTIKEKQILAEVLDLDGLPED